MPRMNAVRLHNDRCRVFLPGLIHTHDGERQCETKFVKKRDEETVMQGYLPSKSEVFHGKFHHGVFTGVIF